MTPTSAVPATSAGGRWSPIEVTTAPARNANSATTASRFGIRQVRASITPASTEMPPTATTGTATAWPKIGHAASEMAAPKAAGTGTRRSLGDGRRRRRWSSLVQALRRGWSPRPSSSPQPLPPPTSGLSIVPLAGSSSRNRRTPRMNVRTGPRERHNRKNFRGGRMGGVLTRCQRSKV